MEGYTNDLTTASDSLRVGSAGAVRATTNSTQKGVVEPSSPVSAGAGADGVGDDVGVVTGQQPVVQFAVHQRDELYTYMADTSITGSVRDAPAPGYTALSRFAAAVVGAVSACVALRD